MAFAGKYYEYDGKTAVTNKGLTIGGYESAWLADLAIAFLLEQRLIRDHFKMCTYFGIYRDDGIAVIPRKMVKAEMSAWLESFQTAINLFCENDFLQFTVTIWGKERNDNTKNSKVSVDENNYFPFLDTEIY